ncbi:hypothetical protein ACFQY4_07645 [Catellatospora bangladeshensis]|uniref:Lipoprotein n=1 Tax=Catellatospora bangladeshensis TaxID=310355 RepID=A0A8J3JGV9_9ACTN|nr:hypothetical protein [Catellatospora bangladeshensis]GIF78735.1 hypothetical protein Cba03nite_00840 [Catellatospora bangladeshensis]
MYQNRLVLSGLAFAAAIAMAGCDPQPGSEPSAASPAPAASSAAPAVDAATAKACADIKKALKDNADKIAVAEKIGPPAGHIAVSAQWTAGSASVIAFSIGASGPVGAAADKVQQEMAALADAYDSATAKPGKEKLEAALKELDTACSAN